MLEQIDVVYANGVLRPVGEVPSDWQEQQRMTILVERNSDPSEWLADADPSIRLEDVRAALAKTSDTIANLVRQERDES